MAGEHGRRQERRVRGEGWGVGEWGHGCGSVARGWREVGGVWLESRRQWMCGVEVHAYGVLGRAHGWGGIDGLSRWMV